MGILQHDSERVAQVIFFDLVDIDTVIADLAVLDIVETVDQVGDGRLSGTGAADKGNFLTRRSVEIYVCLLYTSLLVRKFGLNRKENTKGTRRDERTFGFLLRCGTKRQTGQKKAKNGKSSL